MDVIQCVANYTSLGQRYLVRDGTNCNVGSKTDIHGPEGKRK